MPTVYAMDGFPSQVKGAVLIILCYGFASSNLAPSTRTILHL